MLILLLKISLVWLLALHSTNSADAQQPGRERPIAGPVFLDPSHADFDFQLQGEYLGWQQVSRRQRDTQTAGLQVVALGQGEFAATGYPGGLPGAGWHGNERQRFRGQGRGDVAELAGAGVRLMVDGQTAWLLSADGRTAGEFRKVQRSSPTIGALPPQGATVLFSGGDTSRFHGAVVTPDGLLQAGAETAQAYGDFRMHAEFRLPFKPQGRGQDRGNSGFYLQNRYEVQVLDSFGLEGVENDCGAVYKSRRPDINMCYPPLAWQTYDIDFTAPRFDEQGQKQSDMRLTLWHNGVPIHANVAIPHKTGAGRPEGPDPLPTIIQDHANPVMYRNIWLLERLPARERL